MRRYEMEDISHLIDMHLIHLKGLIDIWDRFEIHYQKKTPIMQHIKMLFFTSFLKKQKKNLSDIQSKPMPTSLPFRFKLHFSLLFY